ncbi:MAG: glutamate--tRNA ligase [Candidatus Heimdallarchaeota archaeon]
MMMSDSDLIIKKVTLANALKHKGRADVGAIMKHIMAEQPEWRTNAKTILERIKLQVQKVNAMSKEQQETLWAELAPGEPIKPIEKLEKECLPPLEGAKEGHVVTRFPPEPSGYLHIGHGYTIYINWYYARKYKGRFILRFEDSNPRKVEERFYEIIREDLRLLKLDWDEEILESDRVPKYYEFTEQLLKQGDAYVCKCSQEFVQQCRRSGQPCSHHDSSIEQNLDEWEKILHSYQEGEAVVRLRGDLKAEESALRDPTIMRIVDHPHPIQGDAYRVWPLYDYAVSIEDALSGITHVLRSEEFVPKIPLQNLIREKLGLKSPQFIHYSRFKIRGTPVQRRVIRDLINTGFVSGWDDIRLSTLSGLIRRGIVPDTIKQLVCEIGLTTGQPELDWSIVLAINRKIIDPIAKRFFMVINPYPLKVSSAPTMTVTLHSHPTHPELGLRQITTTGQFYISREDAMELNSGKMVRLKDLYDIKILKVDNKEVLAEHCNQRTPDIPKIQWVTENSIPTTLTFPDVLLLENNTPNPKSLVVKSGLAETNLQKAQIGEIIQLERIGFGRIDKIDKEKIVINMTEKN